jgi:hypothetical protein
LRHWCRCPKTHECHKITFTANETSTLDLSFVRDLVQETYANMGRPSIDPVVFWHRSSLSCFLRIFARNGCYCGMQQIGEVGDGRLRYDLDELLPDHSSLTRLRTRYGLEVFRYFARDHR